MKRNDILLYALAMIITIIIIQIKYGLDIDKIKKEAKEQLIKIDENSSLEDIYPGIREQKMLLPGEIVISSSDELTIDSNSFDVYSDYNDSIALTTFYRAVDTITVDIRSWKYIDGNWILYNEKGFPIKIETDSTERTFYSNH